MVTFDICNDINNGTTQWKITVENRTSRTPVHYDFDLPISRNAYNYRIVGQSRGTVWPGRNSWYEFKVGSWSSIRRWWFPSAEAWPTLKFPEKSIKVDFTPGSDKWVTRSYTPVVWSRFYPTKSEDLGPYHINLWEADFWTLTEDNHKRTQIIGFGYRVSLDAGGLSLNSKHISYQVYDAM